MSNPQMEAIDYKYLLLEYYKKLRISENELSVILMIDHLLDQKNTLVTPDILCLKMNLSTKELDKIFVALIERGFIVIDAGKKMKVSWKPLQKKLYECFQKEIAVDLENHTNKEKAEKIAAINKTYEEELKRPLSPIEKSLIIDWIEHGYTSDQIVDALKDCLSKGKKTFKSIDKLLYQWQARDDVEKTGLASVTNKWDQNLEKTMEIAKAKWIDD